MHSMLEKGVIQESSSSLAAPINGIKKKSGAWRLCVHCRCVKALTHKDAYPLPCIDEALTSSNLAEQYSSPNLASGYWKVEMDLQNSIQQCWHTDTYLFWVGRTAWSLDLSFFSEMQLNTAYKHIFYALVNHCLQAVSNKYLF